MSMYKNLVVQWDKHFCLMTRIICNTFFFFKAFNSYKTFNSHDTIANDDKLRGSWHCKEITLRDTEYSLLLVNVWNIASFSFLHNNLNIASPKTSQFRRAK